MNRSRAAFAIVFLGGVAFFLPSSSGSTLASREDAKLSSVDFVSQTQVTGGSFAAAGQIPWQVSLRIRKSDASYLCGGSVVREGWVLTAAHCLVDERAGGASVARPRELTAADVDVRSGSLYLGYGGLEAEPSGLWLMPGFDLQTHAFDVALLRVQTSAKALPIALETPSLSSGTETLPAGAVLRTSGYGQTETADRSPVLKYVDVEYVGRTACNSSQSYDQAVLSHMICAGRQVGKDACGGDSGGPLVRLPAAGSSAAPVLVGVVSWAEKGCGVQDFPGVYMQVADPAISKWIATTIAANA